MHVYLIIGGNLGDRYLNLANARKLLEEACGPIIESSSIYETAPWGKSDQQLFLNQALLLESELTPSELISTILQLELQLGRVRNEKNGPRTIDIDILFYGTESIEVPGLTVPHPEMQNRRFVLQPLNEIAPQFIHPIFGKTVQEMLDECTDSLAVNKL